MPESPRSPISRKALTTTEVGRAIYLDYEGNTGMAPVLLGWRFDGVNSQSIVDPTFSTCAGRYKAKAVDERDHQQLVRDLIDRARREDRRIVSWSRHDLNQMLAVLDPEEATTLHSVYRNALDTARPWHRKTRGTVSPDGARLSYFSELLGFPVPDRFGLGIVGDGLRLIRSQIEQQREYAQLSPKARGAWVAIVRHNRLDLEAMEHVLRTITDSDSHTSVVSKTRAA